MRDRQGRFSPGRQIIGAGWATMRKALGLASPEGSVGLAVAGLDGAVDIVRDSWGVPHVRASSINDALAGQGFAHAQDRLFQLDLNRRIGSGRLAEIFGAEALNADRFLRRLGLRHAAVVEWEAMSSPARAYLTAYTTGVNAAINSLGVLPVEFQLLAYEPEPWSELDCLAYAKFMAWNLGFNWDGELIRSAVVRRVGPELAARLDATYPARHPLTAPAGATAVATDMLAEYRRLAPYLGVGGGGASNAWAVASHRSSTGKPFVASDPHLAFRAPSVWYEAHLVAPNMDVAGGTLVGLPGVVIGQNGRIAWGLTAAPVDVQDLYLERLEGGEGDRYEVAGAWHPVEWRDEVITVRGQSRPVVERVRRTRHGPIMHDPGRDGLSLALRWTSWQPDRLVEVLVAVNLASGVTGLREALRRLGGPVLNVVFADSDGHIGYQLAGSVPTRPGGGGYLPVPGWTDEYEWGPPIPFDELPAVLDPPDGIVVSANNRVGDESYPHYLGNDWFNGYRAARIYQLLSERERLTMGDLARVQSDVLSLPGLQLQERLGRLSTTLLSREGRQVVDLFLAWDGEMRAESAGAAVYSLLVGAIGQRLFRPLLGDLTDEFLGLGVRELGASNVRLGRSLPWLLELLNDPDLGGLFAGVVGVSGDGVAAYAELALADRLLLFAIEDAAGQLIRRLGPNVASWRWGRLHRLAWRHPFARLPVVGALFGRGPFEAPGDTETVNYSAVVELPGGARGSEFQWVAGYRMIADLADPTRSVSVVAGGQSGQPLSRHFADQLGAWRSGRHHVLMYDPEAVDKSALGRWLLVPAGSIATQ